MTSVRAAGSPPPLADDAQAASRIQRSAGVRSAATGRLYGRAAPAAVDLLEQPLRHEVVEERLDVGQGLVLPNAVPVHEQIG